MYIISKEKNYAKTIKKPSGKVIVDKIYEQNTILNLDLDKNKV